MQPRKTVLPPNRGMESRAVRDRETVEVELGAAAFRDAWAEGAAMELDGVVRFLQDAG
jgi:hypothetical protein